MKSGIMYFNNLGMNRIRSMIVGALKSIFCSSTSLFLSSFSVVSLHSLVLFAIFLCLNKPQKIIASKIGTLIIHNINFLFDIPICFIVEYEIVPIKPAPPVPELQLDMHDLSNRVKYPTRAVSPKPMLSEVRTTPSNASHSVSANATAMKLITVRIIANMTFVLKIGVVFIREITFVNIHGSQRMETEMYRNSYVQK